jgi:hypothetical protein
MNTRPTKKLINENIGKNISSIIGHTQWNRLHPDDQMTLEQYIAYRQNKERMKEIKEQDND